MTKLLLYGGAAAVGYLLIARRSGGGHLLSLDDLAAPLNGLLPPQGYDAPPDVVEKRRAAVAQNFLASRNPRGGYRTVDEAQAAAPRNYAQKSDSSGGLFGQISSAVSDARDIADNARGLFDDLKGLVRGAA